jgi:hypothetical protein
MDRRNKHLAIAAASALGGLAFASLSMAQQAEQEPPEMGFFVTSVGLGKGGDLGGLEGADAHCQSLAEAAGSSRTWRAYLSTQGEGAVNARDRIGAGPWANANGVVIASNIDDLHYNNANLNYEYALDENGEHFDSRIDDDADTTEHDILTGTQLDGTAFPAGDDRTCSNWTSSTEGSAWVGHADRYSFANPGAPWNSSHGTPACTPEALVQVGGAGLLYCFAAD